MLTFEVIQMVTKGGFKANKRVISMYVMWKNNRFKLYWVLN